MPPKLNPKAFNAFLSGNVGQNFEWRRASKCPCVSPTSGAASPKCPHCSGKGQVWAAPVPAKAGMTQQNINKAWAMSGQYEIGDATLTIPEDSPLFAAGRFDRITMLNSTDRFDVTLVRGAPNERLFFRVVELQRVFWYSSPLNDGTGDVVEGGLPTVAADGALAWGAGAPPTGRQYSISGTRFAEYYVYNHMPSDRAEHFGRRLPKLLHVKTFETFGR